jgi:uncharacterized protein YbbC (DUF1343 family)/CubicO group peptidase (beta-lactamase class C family)
MKTSTSLRRFASGTLAFTLISLQISPTARAQTNVYAIGNLRTDKLTEMDAAINEAIADQKCPGGVLWIQHGSYSHCKAFGNRALVPTEEPMTEDTIFDAASLTKVVACTPAVMLLIERGRLGLEDWVAKYLPEFAAEGKDHITVRQLLMHTSGLRPDISLKPDWNGSAEAIRLSCAEKLSSASGEKVTYSDTGMMLLGEIVQRVSGVTLDQFVKREIYEPLRMKDTGFNPSKEKLARIAPTEVEAGVPARGVVHDPRARRMGGVAGHAGLFLTASDLARYARMLLNLGELDGVRIFKPETVKLMTSVQTPPNVSSRRGLGWDIDSGFSGPRGKIFPLGSYGHTGWTGTSLWIDPFSKTFVIFLSNRNHPTEKGNVTALRARLGTLAAEAVADFDFAHVPDALAPRETVAVRTNLHTLNGVDVLVKNNFAPLKGKRIGLITNHTGHDRERHPTIDLLKNAPGVTLVCLFSPEHGIRGALDEKVPDSVDQKTGLPVYSLYPQLPRRPRGQSDAERAAIVHELFKPWQKCLKDLDALVLDLQDVGCRFYTYTSTMGLCLEAAGEAGIEFIVLDRVNPINGVTLDGPVLTQKTTFVGFHPVPLRYAMTIGELARMFNAEKNYHAKLTVVELESWRRDAWFDETGLPWTNPSPNMRSLKAAILYPGVGLLETAISVGRGTPTPFEIVGAPYVNETNLATELNGAALPGVSFAPIRFTPTNSVHKGKSCGGVFITLTDRARCRVVDVGLQIAKTLQRLYPKNFKPDKLERLLLDAPTLDAVKADKPLENIHTGWQTHLDEFAKRREEFLIYR